MPLVTSSCNARAQREGGFGRRDHTDGRHAELCQQAVVADLIRRLGLPPELEDYKASGGLEPIQRVTVPLLDDLGTQPLREPKLAQQHMIEFGHRVLIATVGGVSAGRYAPSPTGELHLGNLRTAVLAWLFARSTGRGFLLRFEDLDTDRVRPGYDEQQADDLAALGITFDGEPLVQSTRHDRYAEALAVLAPYSFECFCTRREIREAASAPHRTPGRYPGTCRDLPDSERAERRRQRAPAIRLRGGGTETVTDLLHGEISGPIDDVVLQRNDGTPAYNLAVVVDDADTDVDQVVRGDDLLDATPAHIRIAKLLGAPIPTYAHVPLAVNESGTRLAKRDGAVTLSQLAEHGLDAASVLTMIADSLGLTEPGEPITIERLLPRFDPAGVPREPWLVAPIPLRDG